MKPGTQIAYVPHHAQGQVDHPDVQFGFVTSINAHYGDRRSHRRSQPSHFCRYWQRGHEGVELRTTANSESTPNENLVEHMSCDQTIVDRVLAELYPPLTASSGSQSPEAHVGPEADVSPG